jgi:histidine decarboxylase
MKRLSDYLTHKNDEELSELTPIFQSEIVANAAEFYDRVNVSAKRMFGFPAYHAPLSLATQYLLLLHYTAPLSNNCGDVDERGNYAMDSKEIEKRIVKIFADKFGMGDEFWGYITSGGSESNSCGIDLAFAQNPNGILYYSKAAHYSIQKHGRYYGCEEIPVIYGDEMDLNALFDRILYNYQSKGTAANLMLTHGTTQYGACDDVDAIVAFLKKHKIPYYIHLDAALYGGIPNNQTDAPIFTDGKERGINSISVSLHKYLGFPAVKSVFVATQKPNGQKISYIGQHDTTISGSRSVSGYALYNHILEQYGNPAPELYSQNIRYFEELLTERGIPFYRAPKANIFVLDAPSERTCQKFQLSCFDVTENGKNRKKAHVIVFPSHEKEHIRRLTDYLAEDLL